MGHSRAKPDHRNKQPDRKEGRSAPLPSDPSQPPRDAPDTDNSAARNPPASASSPHASPLTPDSSPPEIPGLPVLTTHGRAFITAVTKHNFDLHAAARSINLSDHNLAIFISHPGIQAHLEALFKGNHLATRCKATLTRQFVIDELEELITQTTDPKEKRTLLQHLLRATTAPITNTGAARGMQPDREGGRSEPLHPDPPDASRDAIGRELFGKPPFPLDASMPSPQSQIRNPKSKIPAPPERLPQLFQPKSTDSARDTFGGIIECLKRNDYRNPTHTPDFGINTVAALLEHGAEVDGAPVDTADREKCVQTIRASSIAKVTNLIHQWNYQAAALADNHESHSETVSTTTGPFKVTVELTRAAPGTPSREPGRWLIHRMSIGPGDPWPTTRNKPPWNTA